MVKLLQVAANETEQAESEGSDSGMEDIGVNDSEDPMSVDDQEANDKRKVWSTDSNRLSL